jgi:hypothetical protein
MTQTLSYQNRTLVSLIFVIVVVLIGISILMQERIGYLSFRYPKVILMDLTSHLANYLGYWSAVFVIVVTSILLARRIRCSDIEKRHNSRYFVLLLFGIGAIPQLYPLHDQVHLWYITPILLLACLPFLGKYLLVHDGSKVWLIAFLVISSSLSLFQDFREFQKVRISFTNLAMQGLYGSSADVTKIDEKISELSDFMNTMKFLLDINPQSI